MVRALRKVFDRTSLEVEEAMKEQVAFEAHHPISFDDDQRAARVLQHVMRRAPKSDPVRVRELIHQALQAKRR